MQEMETSRILKVAILPDGCIGVFPDSKNGMYQYIYREAAGVYWDDSKGCFKSTPPEEWGSSKWYQQIVSVVRSGLGLQLILCPETEYDAEEDGFEDAIKLADQHFWR